MRAFFFLFLCGLGSLHAAAPVVSNISASQRPNSRLVDITYDVAADFPTVSVSLQVSSNGGSTFAVPATTLSGAIGAGVATGTAKKITWDAGADWSGQYSTQMRFKVIADDGNSAPTISDIADQTITEGNNMGALAFTIGDAQTAAGSLTLSGSSSNTTLVSNANIVFGGSGANRTVTVTPASGRSGTATITVTVSDGSLSASDTFLLTVNSFVSSSLVLIPAGTFTMGNSISLDADIRDAPPRLVTLDEFYIGNYEVTKAEWEDVRNWAISNGYTDLPAGKGKESNHPVHSISWYQAVKWCNARSQKEGLMPVYYTNDTHTSIYKTGNWNLVSSQVKWNANGYRLPTEAEWEKAARGGLSGKRFPWGDTISHNEANYHSYNDNNYDMSSTINNHPLMYVVGDEPYTSPVGSFKANVYGIYDMAGNVSEWCWDWYGNYASGSQVNPRGVDSAANRVYRGGNFASFSRVAARLNFHPSKTYIYNGFRVVRRSIELTPTISEIKDQIINVGAGQIKIPFTARDPKVNPSYLQLSANSSNSNLVSNANIYFGGSGENRTITISPNYGRSGTSIITITVSNGKLDFSDSFVLNVGFALIPAGSFMMGDSLDGMSDAPVRNENLSAFYIGTHEVTTTEWKYVQDWAYDNGYYPDHGSGKDGSHPVHVSWHAAVQWCNARSVMEGLTPVYYDQILWKNNFIRKDAIYKSGELDIGIWHTDWNADGYRLPTEAEWEKAARGGLIGRRFPSGDVISHSIANYYATSEWSWDLSGYVNNFHPIYYDDFYHATSPVGSFAANAYGLYDMSGNAGEWCWDWYGNDFGKIIYSTGSKVKGDHMDPLGPASGIFRVIRGGSCGSSAGLCRVAYRGSGRPNVDAGILSGFRVVRKVIP